MIEMLSRGSERRWRIGLLGPLTPFPPESSVTLFRRLSFIPTVSALFRLHLHLGHVSRLARSEAGRVDAREVYYNKQMETDTRHGVHVLGHARWPYHSLARNSALR